MDLSSTVELNNGVRMPWLGLGVFKAAPGAETEQAVRWALEMGYRHVDTAAFYANEADVGRAIKDSGVPRDEIFITTKVWNSDQGYEETLAAFDLSRRALGVDVVDLYLVHWPVKSKYARTWKALESLYAKGKVRAIGVSNFLAHHLEDTHALSVRRPGRESGGVPPVPRAGGSHRLRRAGRHTPRGVVPLVRGKGLDNPIIGEIARNHERLPHRSSCAGTFSAES